MAYQLPISGFSADGVRFKEMITSHALWVTSNDGETAQETQGRRGQRAWPGVFSWTGWSAENLFSFFFLFRDDLVWYFSIAKYVLIIRYSEDMENQKDEDKIVILALPQRKVFWYISL